jgi:DNA-binding beta-propeller fold protein YncE
MVAFRFVLVTTIAVLVLFGAPAKNRPAQRSDSGESVLPGGRLIRPAGDQFFTGPGAFGIAISPSGRWVVTADGGPRFAISVLDNQTNRVRHYVTKSRNDRNEAGGDDDDWRSVFMGLAFDGESRVWASEGETGRVRLIDLATGAKIRGFDLNQGGFEDSFSGDIAFDRDRGLLYVVDPANFRLAIVRSSDGRVIASIRTGRLPFAVSLDAARHQAYVTNLGMFEYRVVPGADPKRPEETGLPFPAFGFPSADALKGARRATESGMVDVPPLGDPNVPESNSVAIVTVENPTAPKVRALVRTGLPIGAKSAGGSSPSGVVSFAGKLYVSNANQDTITVIDVENGRVDGEIPLRIAGYEPVRGVLPIGLTVVPERNYLLIAEAGINAIGIVDLARNRLIGHIPTGWFPTQVRVQGETVFVCNAKGHGTGPNSDPATVKAGSFQGQMRRGTISRFRLPPTAALDEFSKQVIANNGFDEPFGIRSRLPNSLDHVVIIVKENRTYDEVLGDLPAASNGPRNGEPALARFGRRVTPNHHAIAQRWAASDNFYADSEVSVDGHHWIVDSYPNAWTNSSWMASYGGQKTFRLPTTAPGRLINPQSNSSVHPEEQLEAGSLWHHLERNGIPFRNFGEGFELAGNYEGGGVEPTGARFFTNVPMPEPLFRNTSRNYPGFNMNIPDQFRAAQFIKEMQDRYGDGKRAFPRLIFIHLPNDHIDRSRPQDGYASSESYVADNDLALGKMLEYLSGTAAWKRMAVFITEDDAQGGVDHVDSHRTVLLVAGPYARKNWVSHINASFTAMLRTVFEILRLPPLNQFDAAAPSLAELFTNTPDPSPYRALPSDPSIFDPSKAKAAPGKTRTRMDDPRFLEQQHRRR